MEDFRYILWTFGVIYWHLVYFVDTLYVYYVELWYILSHFGMLYQEQSGNPDSGPFLLVINFLSRSVFLFLFGEQKSFVS
jgi:hypothetical protein